MNDLPKPSPPPRSFQNIYKVRVLDLADDWLKTQSWGLWSHFGLGGLGGLVGLVGLGGEGGLVGSDWVWK